MDGRTPARTKAWMRSIRMEMSTEERPGPRASTWCCGELVQTLMQHNLVDEYRLMIHPVVVGSGKRLFREGSPRIPLKMVDGETSGTGTLILTCRPGATPAADQQRTD
jgi:dihydrofolate reductase